MPTVSHYTTLEVVLRKSGISYDCSVGESLERVDRSSAKYLSTIKPWRHLIHGNMTGTTDSLLVAITTPVSV